MNRCSKPIRDSSVSRTFSYNVGETIKCFTTNSSGNKAIVVRHSLFSQFVLLSIEADRFEPKARFNLKDPLMCLMDVSWSQIEDNLIVACGSNGELYKLIVTESDLINPQPDTSIKFNERTINKINFHPNEPNLLISGSQDGTIKLIDIRTNICKAISTFKHDADEKVTDCKFNPSLSMKYEFASGSENGSVFIWDIRKPSNNIKKFSPYLGQVHLDYHPEQENHLATASGHKDKQICVYNLLSDCKQSIMTLTHSEPVSSIQWRPKRPTQLTAIGLDAHLYVWDTERPYVPYVSFERLTNKVQSFMWKPANPKVIFASTRDSIWQYHIDDAIRPADNATLVSVQMDKQGSLAFAVGVCNVDKEEALKFTTGVGDDDKNGSDAISTVGSLAKPFQMSTKTSTSKMSMLHKDSMNFGDGFGEIAEKTSNNGSSNEANNSNENVDTITLGSFKNAADSNIPVAGSYSSMGMHQLFKANLQLDQNSINSEIVQENRITKSVLYFEDKIDQTRSDWFLYAAQNYQFKDKDFAELCDHNAQVSLKYDKFNIHKDWLILKTLFKTSNYEDLTGYRDSRGFNFQPDTLTPVTTANNEMDTNSTKIKINTNQTVNLHSMTSSNLLTINASTSTSSSSSAPTSSSMNENCSRIRNYSENDTADITSILLPSSVTDQNQTTNTEKENSDSDKRYGLKKNNKLHEFNSVHLSSRNYYSSNNHLVGMHNEQHLADNQIFIDEYSNRNIGDIKFEDDHDISTLPNDAVEYNDEMNNDFFVNSTKHPKSFSDINNHTSHYDSNQRSIHKKLDMSEDQALEFLRNRHYEAKPHRDHSTKTNADFFSDHHTHQHHENNSNNPSVISNMTLTNANQYLLQPVSLSGNDTDQNKQLIDNIGIPSLSLDENFLKNLSIDFLVGNSSIFSKIDFGSYLSELLRTYVADNDLPTAIFMYKVATSAGKVDNIKIESKELDEWLAQYIEMLAMFELWNLRIEIIKSFQSDFLMDFNNLTQKSIIYEPMCATCKKIIKPNTFKCPSCSKNVFLCAYCHLPVKRLYAWCFKCFHGGHLNHMIKWFKNNTTCPTGCPCNCRFA